MIFAHDEWVFSSAPQPSISAEILMAPGNSLVITFCPMNWMPLGVVMQQL
ncbi:hypothetical protein SynSYN20_02173 [Synechococcus sp. SYN20]|nr:hypothetical protein SynSYN20_02173 [Synechococcus sp. SYN20]